MKPKTRSGQMYTESILAEPEPQKLVPAKSTQKAFWPNQNPKTRSGQIYTESILAEPKP
jgi:hypothetical protein